ncbi:hypothetical protein CVU75_00420 [Candidatus Dependentiae bacterium HGW-Dependentiae-1]|nr:MAG: hypothetical protein CVU75_00420 [Candidatus Dependentiae bacterium HGW-Dependentiae-1]
MFYEAESFLMISFIQTILFFAVKVVLIEWAIGLVRLFIYWIRQGALPTTFFLAHSNLFLHWGLGVLETGCVVLLLLLGFNVLFIIIFDILLIYLTMLIAGFFIQPR